MKDLRPIEPNRPKVLMRWVLPLLLSLGCSIGSAQIEPNAGKWKTWVLTSSDVAKLVIERAEKDGSQ